MKSYLYYIFWFYTEKAALIHEFPSFLPILDSFISIVKIKTQFKLIDFNLWLWYPYGSKPAFFLIENLCSLALVSIAITNRLC